MEGYSSGGTDEEVACKWNKSFENKPIGSNSHAESQ